jgi:hypothetical protein
MDISGLLGSTGTALEAEAYKQFGAAVNNQVDGKLAGLFSLPGSGASKGIAASDARADVANAKPRTWDTTKYAAATADFKGGNDPKNKFLFKVRFKMHEATAQKASSLGVNIDAISSDLTFAVKQIDLPKVDFEYEEVNMYNFKTKVLKSIKHRDLNIILYDDVGNHALALINVYMEMLSPISQMKQNPSNRLEDYGFAFNTAYRGLDTAGRGTLPGNSKDVLSELIIEQFYVNMSTNGASGQSITDIVKLNRFNFINPRIQQFDISDQDHEQGGTSNTISIVFDYDAMHIDVNQLGSSSQIPLPRADVLNNVYPTAGTTLRGPTTQAGATNNPFVDILARQGQRMVQTTVGGQLNKMLGGIGGGALSGTVSSITGALGGAASRTLSGLGSGIEQGISKGYASVVNDNASVTDTASQTASSDPLP